LHQQQLDKPGKIILGIDPGTLMMGYCILHVHGSHLKMHEMDILRLQSKLDAHQKLQTIYSKVDDLIKTHQPDCFAIEAPFFGKNVQSMLKLGRAQGVAIAAAIAAGLQVCEYSPKKIKQSITGNGNAGKEQVWRMLQQTLSIQHITISNFDASDALAVAVCHHYQDRNPELRANTKSRSWKDFVALHPQRLAK
jgi:crossover junction endodeoxyribonuclease RuvC